MRRVAGLALIVLIVCFAAGPLISVASGHDANETDSPSIERVYPNPVASGDAGEYVVISLPAGVTPSNASLSDDTRTVSLANVTRRGPMAISTDPGAAANLTDAPVANASGLALANAGERLTLRVDGSIRDTFEYADAPEGEVGVDDEAGRVRWRPLAATDFDVAAAGPGEVRAFVLPDAPDVPLEHLRRADERILLGGYTLSSERIASALIDAHRRGVAVRVLLEGNPVGSRTRAEATQLDRLADAGVDVRVVAGEQARVQYHHAKYAVADDRALVMTENWKPAGTGGNGSRGWGVVTGQSALVGNLTATFEADAGWRDGVRWSEFRQGKSFEQGEAAVGDYPREFTPRDVPVDRTELLATPDNGGDRLVELLDDADDSIAVVQASMGDWEGKLPTSLRRAAQRGVEVRILLSSAWYSEEDNQQTVDRFREWANRADADLEVQLAEPGGQFEKIHAKGAIIDGERTVVGSLNWNDAAMTSNREILLVLHGTEAADYFGQVFDADWSGGGGWAFPAGLAFAVVGAALLAGAVLVKIRFERSEPTGVGPVTGDDGSGIPGNGSNGAGEHRGSVDEHPKRGNVGERQGRGSIHAETVGSDHLRDEEQYEPEGDAPEADDEADE